MDLSIQNMLILCKIIQFHTLKLNVKLRLKP
jgi:hypothetical protein